MKTRALLFSLLLLFFVDSSKAQNPANPMAAKKADASKVPATYTFSWKYMMEIKSGAAKAMTAEYLLEPNAQYFGINMGANNMFMVMDTKNNITVSAFTKGKEKMAMASKIPDYSAMADKKNMSKFTYKALPEKTILGYRCKGVQATNPDYVMVFYYTNDAKITFADMFKSQSQSMPDAFKNFFKPGEKPLIMSVDITDVKKKTKTSMKCTGLVKSPFTFHKADYKFM